MERHRPQLHIRNDRRPEGRRHAPPRCLSQCDWQRARVEHAAVSGLSLDPAHVPLQWLVFPMEHRRAVRHERVSEKGGTGRDLPADEGASGDALLRRSGRSQHVGVGTRGAAGRPHASHARDGGWRIASGTHDRRSRAHQHRAHPHLRSHGSVRAERGVHEAGGVGIPSVWASTCRISARSPAAPARST